MSKTAELMPVEINQITEFREFDKKLAEYKERYDGIVYDLSNHEDDKRARSDRLSIGKVISRLDAKHKEIKAPLKAKVDLIDGERKRIKDQLLEIQGGIKAQIEDHEAAIQAVKDALLRKASEFRDLSEFDCAPTSAMVKDRIEQIKSRIIDESYGEFEALAALNKDKALQLLEPMFLGLQAQEKEAQEADAARLAAEQKARKEREEQIAREAEERARIAAEKAAAKAKADADAAIERERQAALAAKLEAEQARKDAEEASKRAREDAEQAQRDKEAAEKAEREKREADKQHRVKINRAAADAFMEFAELDDARAKAVVIAIAEGKVPNTKIHY